VALSFLVELLRKRTRVSSLSWAGDIATTLALPFRDPLKPNLKEIGE
jgi:hypothetical protein